MNINFILLIKYLELDFFTNFRCLKSNFDFILSLMKISQFFTDIESFNKMGGFDSIDVFKVSSTT